MKNKMLTVTFEKDLSNGKFYIEGFVLDVKECYDSMVGYESYRLYEGIGIKYIANKVYRTRDSEGNPINHVYRVTDYKGDFVMWLDKFNKVKE